MSLLQFVTRRLVSTPAKPAARKPVLLQPAELKAVSGGGPRGTWEVLTDVGVVEGPRGSW